MPIQMTSSSLQEVPQCPRCNRANPTFRAAHPPVNIGLSKQDGGGSYWAGLYVCNTCDRSVLVESDVRNHGVFERELVVNLYPETQTIKPEIIGRSRVFLSDALASLNAPTASIMSSCSAIDAMLKERDIKRTSKDGKERSLYHRIQLAVEQGVLTKDMSEWAHKIRLDANDQRHADEDAELPTQPQAQNVFDLAIGLAEILFVLPAKSQAPEDNG